MARIRALCAWRHLVGRTAPVRRIAQEGGLCGS